MSYPSSLLLLLFSQGQENRPTWCCGGRQGCHGVGGSCLQQCVSPVMCLKKNHSHKGKRKRTGLCSVSLQLTKPQVGPRKSRAAVATGHSSSVDPQGATRTVRMNPVFVWCLPVSSLLCLPSCVSLFLPSCISLPSLPPNK